MSSISATLREQVIRRAGKRCEYCGLSQLGQEAHFHVSHVVPVIEGGQTNSENLALTCTFCSLKKGSCFVAVDPLTGKRVPLFNPRSQGWHEHFAWNGARMLARSAIGRGTLQSFKMNRVLVQAIRAEEQAIGRHPPPKPKR